MISKAKELFQNSTAGNDITISMNLIHNKKNFGRDPTILQVFVFRSLGCDQKVKSL